MTVTNSCLSVKQKWDRTIKCIQRHFSNLKKTLGGFGQPTAKLWMAGVWTGRGQPVQSLTEFKVWQLWLWLSACVYYIVPKFKRPKYERPVHTLAHSKFGSRTLNGHCRWINIIIRFQQKSQYKIGKRKSCLIITLKNNFIRTIVIYFQSTVL